MLPNCNTNNQKQQQQQNNPCHTTLKTKFAPQHLLELENNKNNPKIAAPNSHAKHE